MSLLMTWQPGVLVEGVSEVRALTEVARLTRLHPALLERESGLFGVLADGVTVVRRGDVIEVDAGRAVAVKRRRSGL